MVVLLQWAPLQKRSTADHLKTIPLPWTYLMVSKKWHERAWRFMHGRKDTSQIHEERISRHAQEWNGSNQAKSVVIHIQATSNNRYTSPWIGQNGRVYGGGIWIVRGRSIQQEGKSCWAGSWAAPCYGSNDIAVKNVDGYCSRIVKPWVTSVNLDYQKLSR